MSVLPIAEARRRLPELVHKVAAGHPPIAIGRRGRPEAVIAAPGAVRPVRPRRSLRGLARLVGDAEGLDQAQAELLAALQASLARTARQIDGEAEAFRP
ncbi:MAG: type II toxin-antitoxin system Phd/YefM family antitoxin [Deltaproteobacteria bacterium]|nr:type II toxin-antitoxin system Phd/YefM family antitoxin [Deltaproteobacteria bacterium]